MIRAHFGKGSLRVTGHAGFCPGNDIVCAGVSAIVQTLAGYLENMRGVRSETVMRPGDFSCAASGADEAFAMARIGLLQIQRAYPEYVTVLDDAPGAAIINMRCGADT